MAALLLRAEVESSGSDALIAGDIGPSGSIMMPIGTLDFDEAVDVFAGQATALVAGGVDLIWIETMSDLEEIRAAIVGIRQVAPAIPIIATMTFDTRGHTMMGVKPESAVHALADYALQIRDAGASIIGACCGSTPAHLTAMAEALRTRWARQFLSVSCLLEGSDQHRRNRASGFQPRSDR